MRDAAKVLFVLVCMMALLVPFSSAQSRREQRQQPEKLLDIAGIKPGMIVGEAGAGEGFLTFFISRRIGDEGRVYANDIDKNALRRLNERCAREGVKNITTILGEVADPCFPVKDLDVVTMIYAFHDFEEKAAWLMNVKKYLKKNAAIYIFDAQDQHTGMSKEALEKLGKEAGFQLTRCEQIHGGLWVYVLEVKEKKASHQAFLLQMVEKMRWRFGGFLSGVYFLTSGLGRKFRITQTSGSISLKPRDSKVMRWPSG